MDDLIEDVTRLIFESSFMTVATADDDGVPWISPVELACDEELQFYWFSSIATRHSQNVRANPQAALSIYDCTYVPLEGHPRVVPFRVTVRPGCDLDQVAASCGGID